MTPYDKSRAAFNGYAGMDAPDLPDSELSALQVRLTRWNNIQFNHDSGNMCKALGVSEELGELADELILNTAMSSKVGRMCQAVLKQHQGIRGFDKEKSREAVADAVADMVIFAIQLCTSNRIDFGTLVQETASEVMQRDWKLYPKTGLPPGPDDCDGCGGQLSGLYWTDAPIGDARGKLCHECHPASR